MTSVQPSPRTRRDPSFAERARPAAQSRHPVRCGAGRRRPRQPVGGRAPGGDACRSGARSRRSGRRPGWCKAMECIDLTTLSGDDTEGRVRRLCAKARQPLACRSPGGARPRRPADHHRRGLRLSPLRGDGEGGAGGLRHSGRRGLDGVSGRSGAASRRGFARSRRRSPTAPTRSTSSSPASMC